MKKLKVLARKIKVVLKITAWNIPLGIGKECNRHVNSCITPALHKENSSNSSYNQLEMVKKLHKRGLNSIKST